MKTERGDSMEQQENAGLVNRGCWSRLKRCMNRGEHGEDLTIAFLGGSITQGSAATADDRCYAYLTWKWWQKKFPATEVTYINAGIGGTSSLFGCARAAEDVLSKKPDVIFVDFTVNDEATDFFQETFEGLLRRRCSGEGNPAVVVLNNVYYDSGLSAQEKHNAVAAHYEIPCVSARESIYQKIRHGIFQTKELTEDCLHPNDRGHELLAGELTGFLDMVWRERDRQEEEKPFPAPLTANTYERTVRYQTGNSRPLLAGFRKDERPKTGYYDHFKQGWIGERIGDKIAFRINCRNLAVQFRKSVHHPVPVARIIVDGKKENAVILDGNFQESWGDCLYLQPVLHHGEPKEHQVVIEIIRASEQDVEPFYLMSLICA